MKTHLDCFPCLLNQALRAARTATDDENIHRRVIDAVADMIPGLPLDLKPPELAQQAYRIIHQITGDSDPYRREKEESNRAALAVYPRLKQMVGQSSDGIYTACKLAIIGNSIDFGPSAFDNSNLEGIIDAVIKQPLAVNSYDSFLNRLHKCRSLLYLGDNAGEIVLDRLLIEELCQSNRDLEVNFVVRGGPVINDATLEDAMAVKMDGAARVISNGSDAPATILSQCSEEVNSLYQSSDIIIVKGQGNYESLEGEKGNAFFFLRAKCQLMAGLLGVKVGDFILKENPESIF